MKIMKKIPLLLIPLLLVACQNETPTSGSQQPGPTGSYQHHHDLLFVEQKDPTCMEPGIKEYYQCRICEEIFQDTDALVPLTALETIDKLPHTISVVESVIGDCYTPTIKKHYKCDVCQELFLDEAGTTPTTLDDLKEASDVKHHMVLHSGNEVTYNVDGMKPYYQCERCERYFADENGEEEIRRDSLAIASDGWLRFGLSTSTDGAGVKSERAMLEDSFFEKKEVLTSRITYTQGLSAGATYNHQSHVNKLDGVNARIPQVQGKKFEYKVIVRNNTEKSIHLKVYLNDVDAGSAITVQLQGNERKALEGSYVCSGSTPGGWVKVEAVEAIESGASFDFMGYVKTKDYWEFEPELHVIKEASKTLFKAGETFQSDGLVAYVPNQSYQDTTVNFATNYDGHVFSEEDVGTKTVRVMFAGAVYEYEIRVLTAQHIHEGVHFSEVATTYNADGIKEHYYCEGCDKYFSDKNCQTEVQKETLMISSEGWLRFGLSTSTSGTGVKSERAMIEDTIFEQKNVLGSHITYTQGLSAGASYFHQTHANDTSDGVNARVRQEKGKTLFYQVIVKNNTEKPIHLKVYLNDVDAGSAVTIQLQGNETKTLQGSYICSGSTSGGWVKVEAVETVESGASFDFLGYMKTKDYWNYENTMHVLQEATKKTFQVGDTFTSEGLLVDIPNDTAFQDTVANYITNYDGYTFLASDVGTHTVTVRFGHATVTYDIVVQ